MSLTGSQVKQLQKALVDAFDEASLAQMLRIYLDEKLSAVAGGHNLNDTVFRLIEWAERTGRTSDLLSGALAANPRNPELREFLIAGLAGISEPTYITTRVAAIFSDDTIGEDEKARDCAQLFDELYEANKASRELGTQLELSEILHDSTMSVSDKISSYNENVRKSAELERKTKEQELKRFIDEYVKDIVGESRLDAYSSRIELAVFQIGTKRFSERVRDINTSTKRSTEDLLRNIFGGPSSVE